MWFAALLTLALALSACAPSGPVAIGAAPHATETGLSAPFTPVSPGWRLYTDPRYGFAIQYPPGATLDPPASQGTFTYMGWRLASAKDSANAATLLMTVTPQPSASLCAEMARGAPVSIGSGVTAHQFDNLATPPPTGVTQPLQISTLFTSGGLFTIITLSGNPPASTFLQRWGTVWRDTLASYVPGHSPSGVHPCV
jgi:hypothetical protein